jgi:hypothetical protein
MSSAHPPLIDTTVSDGLAQSYTPFHQLLQGHGIDASTIVFHIDVLTL